MQFANVFVADLHLIRVRLLWASGSRYSLRIFTLTSRSVRQDLEAGWTGAAAGRVRHVVLPYTHRRDVGDVEFAAVVAEHADGAAVLVGVALASDSVFTEQMRGSLVRWEDTDIYADQLLNYVQCYTIFLLPANVIACMDNNLQRDWYAL